MFECALAFIFSRVLITFHHRSYHLNSGNFEFNRHFVRQIFCKAFIIVCIFAKIEHVCNLCYLNLMRTQNYKITKSTKFPPLIRGTARADTDIFKLFSFH